MGVGKWGISIPVLGGTLSSATPNICISQVKLPLSGCFLTLAVPQSMAKPLLNPAKPTRDDFFYLDDQGCFGVLIS